MPMCFQFPIHDDEKAADAIAMIGTRHPFAGTQLGRGRRCTRDHIVDAVSRIRQVALRCHVARSYPCAGAACNVRNGSRGSGGARRLVHDWCRVRWPWRVES